MVILLLINWANPLDVQAVIRSVLSMKVDYETKKATRLVLHLAIHLVMRMVLR